jgi:epoxyqueuosine reductase
MNYLERNIDKRVDSKLLLDGAKSAIVVLEKADDRQDYHVVIKSKLNVMLEYLKSQNAKARAFVDTAPILEKALAVKAGLGWQGKNTLLINPKYGATTNIGVILTDAQFDSYDSPFSENLCANCTKCIDACPTQAIVEAYCLDARRCLAYTEFELPRLNGKGGNGLRCSVCREVCGCGTKNQEPGIADD